jgi:hypothetical protein
MAKWVNTKDKLPPNQERESCNKYHFVKYQYEDEDATNYALSKGIAMYMNGEWWIDYHAKLMYPVIFWLDDEI